jgi:adenosylhomocysteine nucleosidase
VTVPGIAVALEAELSSLAPHAIAPGSYARLPSGALVAAGGVGLERARALAGRLLDAGATALVSWGIAAGLDPRLAAGALVLPERVIGVEGTAYRVAVEWHDRLRARLASAGEVSVGLLISTGDVVETPAAKRALLERHGAVAADMESSAVARVAAERGVPFVALRAIADPAGGRAPGWVARLLDPSGRVPVGRALGQALLHPRDWVALVALALHFRTARRALRRAGPALLALEA